MSDAQLESSDSVRSGRPLRHARQVTLPGPFQMESGGVLPEVVVAYETYGTLSAARDNVVLVCHAISGDSHVARHNAEDDPGWWDVVVGPGRAIDTDRWYVVCTNLLGGCRGSTGPGGINPETGRPYGRDFPTTTVGDMVEVQRRLLDQLGIPRLRAVVGGSMGGHQALAWATRYPERVEGAILLATAARLTSQALAFDVVGRNAILRDPHFHGGQYYESERGPEVGLAIARMIGHITYLSREAMSEKFEADRLAPRSVPMEFERRFSVGSYLGHQGQKFVERFDANSYITLSLAMDLFDLGGTPEALAASFRSARCRWLVISFSSDWLFPPEQSVDMVNALVRRRAAVSYCNVTTSCGHDAFLLPDDVDRYGRLIEGFLAQLGPAAPAAAEEPDVLTVSPTSIFHRHRVDYDRIAQLIPATASVLDLGCGHGGLLTELRRAGARRLVGLEIDERAIVTCVGQGIDVIHADLNRGLRAFGDGEFDFVVLSQTLQAIYDIEGLMAEMLRVGRTVIVSFPNFAYRDHRRQLAEAGHAPKGGILHYEWHNSPNIRFLSIADFEEFCGARGIQVERRMAFDTETGGEVFDDPNLNADLALFVVSRGSAKLGRAPTAGG